MGSLGMLEFAVTVALTFAWGAGEVRLVQLLHSFDHLSFHFPRFLEAFYWRRMSDLRQQPKTKDFDLLDQRQNAPKRLASVRPVCAGVLLGTPKWNSGGLKRSWIS